MKKLLRNAAIIVVCLSAFGCAPSPQKPQMTPLEIQAMQTRSYENGYDVVFRSVVSVFQDLGYTIQNADKETGFIQANSAASSNEMLKLWTGATQTTQTKATAFVEQISGKTRVRINFVVASEGSTAYGASSRNEKPVLSVDVYQNAFEKIENAIFVRTGSS
jgi:hypothetical protein